MVVRSLFVVLVGWSPAADVMASAPMVKTQSPGYYRMMLGDFEVTALSDGNFALNTTRMMTNVPRGGLKKLLAESFEGETVSISVNAYLINTGDRLVLVDAGAAHLFGPTLGRLLSNLTASGYRPDQVATVLITHMHPDHIGGLLLDGQRAFSNATVLAETREADFWLDGSASRQAAAGRKDLFAGVASPYISAGRFERFTAPAALFPGISAIPAPGHTPGHTMFAVESKGKKLLLWGDLMEIATVQFAEPAVTMVFDEDAARAAAQRLPAYVDAARGAYLVAVSHLPFPGLGHVRMQNARYSWVPLAYGGSDEDRPADPDSAPSTIDHSRRSPRAPHAPHTGPNP